MLESIVGTLVGVITGACLAWEKDSWSERVKKESNARFLAVRVVCVLDDLQDRCASIASDRGEGESYHSTGRREPDTELPSGLVLPDDVDWKSIEHKLAYRILSLPDKIKRSNRLIAFAAEYVTSPVEVEGYFVERRDRYVCIGLEVGNILQNLRDTYDIPQNGAVDDFWSPQQVLNEMRVEIDKCRSNTK